MQSRNCRDASNGEAAVTNVVFMGMGEPLANYRNRGSCARTTGVGLVLRLVEAASYRQYIRDRAAHQ